MDNTVFDSNPIVKREPVAPSPVPVDPEPVSIPQEPSDKVIPAPVMPPVKPEEPLVPPAPPAPILIPDS